MSEQLRRLDELTPDERRVLGYLVAGHTDEDIATARGVRRDTVRSWVCDIMRILPADRRHRHVLIAVAIPLGIEAVPLRPPTTVG